MSSDHEPQAGIYVDETHAYNVSLGRQTLIEWGQPSSLMTVRVQLPYDGQLRYDDARLLKDVHSDVDTLSLGHVEVILPGNATHRMIPIALPAGADLTRHLKSNKWARLPRSISIDHPAETLVAVEGHIFDGASLDLERLRDLIFGQTEAFVRDLRLRLSFWVPDLFARSRQSRERELREMLLQRESARQIFIGSLGNQDQLAESLAALANTSGGRILIGVDRHGQIAGFSEKAGAPEYAELKLALLMAALRCSPPVPFFTPDYFETAEGRTVVRVVVPEGGGPYAIDGTIYRREGATTAGRPATSTAAAPVAAPIANLEHALGGENDDVIILDAAGDLERVDLGPSICALINAGKRDGLILIRNPAAAAGGSLSWPGRRGASVLQQLEARLEQELRRCLPRLALRPALARLQGEQIGVVRVTSELAPAALYDGTAYEWHNRALRSIGVQDLFARYLQRQRTGETDRSASDRVQITYGELSWPIQPAPTVRNGRNGMVKHDDHSSYEVQRRAIVWGTRRFSQDSVTIGWRGALTAQLQQALMDVGETGDAVRSLDKLRASVIIRINDVLASGATLQVHPASKALDHLPIHRRTNLRLQIAADPQELFKQRRRMSLLRFRLPDVSLDHERVGDVAQACADLGFRIHSVDTGMLPERARLEGIRGEGFCDITLLVGMLCERTPLSRALNYDQRTDSRATHLAALDIRVALWGSGDTAAAEVRRLHMALHQLLHQRLFYLRTE